MMDNTELLKFIKFDFELISPGLSNQSLEETIRSLVRNINRLQAKDKELSLSLKKIAADLISSYTSQVQYSELKHKSENPGLKVKPDFDQSFFKSLDILKSELFILLEKI